MGVAFMGEEDKLKDKKGKKAWAVREVVGCGRD